MSSRSPSSTAGRADAPRGAAPRLLFFGRPVRQSGCPGKSLLLGLLQAVTEVTSLWAATLMRCCRLLERPIPQTSAGAIEVPQAIQRNGVVVLPKTIPWRLNLMIFHRFGPPPWIRKQVQALRPKYEAVRTEQEAR